MLEAGRKFSFEINKHENPELSAFSVEWQYGGSTAAIFWKVWTVCVTVSCYILQLSFGKQKPWLQPRGRSQTKTWYQFYRIRVPVGPWRPRKIFLSSKMMNYQPQHIEKRETVDNQKIKYKYKSKKRSSSHSIKAKMLRYKNTVTCCSWTELSTDNSTIGSWGHLGRDLLASAAAASWWLSLFWNPSRWSRSQADS